MAAFIGRPLTLLAVLLLLLLAFSEASAARDRVRNRRQLWIERDVSSNNNVEIIGDVVPGADNTFYLAFKGIGYAKPPVGKLRFKGPVLHLSQRPDRREGPKCAQITVPEGRQEGQEDCLYLNVFTPCVMRGSLCEIAPEHSLLPVMVYIHGGGFQYGSGLEAENGPQFLVRHGVVLVTINYRLSTFGFLSLDNDDVPGNMGLKDQQTALQWVQNYIKFFGGDPARVTIFGCSAGAASVHYHSIVPSSKGLFHTAVMQSGNALASFAYTEAHPEMARRLNVQLGGSNTSSPAEMFQTFMKADTNAIVSATQRIIQADQTLQLGFPPFAPSPERRREGVEKKFLPQDPESLERKLEHFVPTVIGISGEEGHFASYYGGLEKKPQLLAVLAQNPILLLPPNLLPYEDTARQLGLQDAGQNRTLDQKQAKGFADGIQRKYGLPGTGNSSFIKFYGDLFTGVATHRLAKLRLDKGAPLYMYHFVLDGDYNWGKKSFNMTGAEGVATHTDELGYLMHITSPPYVNLEQTTDGASRSSRALNLLTELWTDFAKYSQLDHRNWPMAVGPVLTAPFAKITDVVNVGSGLGSDRMELWDKIFGSLRGDKA